MSFDAVLQVNEAEKEAHEILLEAQNRARERVAAAQTAAEKKLADTKKQLAAEAAEATAAERQRNEAYTAQQLALSGQDCEQLRRLADEKLEAAVQLIMRRVVS